MEMIPVMCLAQEKLSPTSERVQDNGVLASQNDQKSYTVQDIPETFTVYRITVPWHHELISHEKMEKAYSLMCMLILPIIRGTEGTPLGAAEKLKTGDNLGENWQNVVWLEPRNISAMMGEDVSLVVDAIMKSQLQDVQWVRNGVNFATTKPNSGVTIRDRRYGGRLSSSGDGSLVIHNTTMDDQGEYKADALLLNLTKYSIVYYLHVSEQRQSDRTHVALVVVVSVILVSVLVVAAAVAFMRWKRKTSFGNQRRNEEIHNQEDNSKPGQETLQPRGSGPSPPDSDDKTEDSEDEEFFLAPQSFTSHTSDPS